jgi:hypothetical protein
MKFLNWIKRLFMSALNSIKGIVIDLFKNAEAAVILTFSAIGLTTILAEIPFHYALPAFIDGALVLPVISIFIILILITSMQWRMYAGEHI